jgi:hypothetical protein
MNDTPQNGWYPDDESALFTQTLFKDGKMVANIVRQFWGWRAFSLTELNKTQTTGKPIGDTVTLRSDAKLAAEKAVN